MKTIKQHWTALTAVLLKFFTFNMSGKMVFMDSLSTSPFLNQNCSNYSTCKKFVCSKCYSMKMLKFRQTLRRKLFKNSIILSNCLLTDFDIQAMKFLLNRRFFRFEAFGDLINFVHLENYIRITKYYPECTFTLFTKRIDLINTYFDKHKKPDNLILIYSEPLLNGQPDNVYSTIKYRHFDKIFIVYDNNANVVINCQSYCIECQKCYTKTDKTKIIKERIKKG